MSLKSYRLDPSLNTVSDLVTDEEMQASFSGTNFGHTHFRDLLAQGCIKSLAGWHQGHTITCILEELRLISWHRPSGKTKVTAKGRHYIWLSFKNRPGAIKP